MKTVTIYELTVEAFDDEFFYYKTEKEVMIEAKKFDIPLEQIDEQDQEPDKFKRYYKCACCVSRMEIPSVDIDLFMALLNRGRWALKIETIWENPAWRELEREIDSRGWRGEPI